MNGRIGNRMVMFHPAREAGGIAGLAGWSAYFFFLGATGLASFAAGAFALAFFLSLPCELLPFAMIRSFP